MAMATVAAAANMVKSGGTLFLSCCNRNRTFRGRLPTSLSISTSLSRPRFGIGVDDNTLSAARNVRCTPSYCTSSPAEISVTSPSSVSVVHPLTDVEAATTSDPVKEAAGMLDIRVGKIIKAWIHEEADSLYVEEVDVGEPEPRIICSGLVKYIPLHDLQDTKVVVLANLKPRNMRGVKSCGMLMAASDASHKNVQLLIPPEGSLPGERIWFGSEKDQENQPAAASPNQIQKKKTWEMVQPHLKTDGYCSATLGKHFMRTSTGVVTCTSLTNANIS